MCKLETVYLEVAVLEKWLTSGGQNVLHISYITKRDGSDHYNMISKL